MQSIMPELMGCGNTDLSRGCLQPHTEQAILRNLKRAPSWEIPLLVLVGHGTHEWVDGLGGNRHHRQQAWMTRQYHPILGGALEGGSMGFFHPHSNRSQCGPAPTTDAHAHNFTDFPGHGTDPTLSWRCAASRAWGQRSQSVCVK